MCGDRLECSNIVRYIVSTCLSHPVKEIRAVTSLKSTTGGLLRVRDGNQYKGTLSRHDCLPQNRPSSTVAYFCHCRFIGLYYL